MPGGYLKLGARFYNPTTGAFTQPGNMGEPLRLNAYLYSAGDPINNSDASGRWYGDIGLSGCILACGEISVGYDGHFDITLGAGVGPDIGGSLDIGGGYGTTEGGEWSTACGVVAGPGGAYAEVGVGEGAEVSAGGGYSVGLGGGCSTGVSYTW